MTLILLQSLSQVEPIFRPPRRTHPRPPQREKLIVDERGRSKVTAPSTIRPGFPLLGDLAVVRSLPGN